MNGYRHIEIRLCFLLLFLVLAWFNVLAANATDTEIISRMNEIVPGLIKEGEVPGLSVAWIRGSKIVFHRSYGFKNAETLEMLRDDAVFEAASLSKPVFAYAVLKLTQSGKLKLDEPLVRYLQEPYVQNDERLHLISTRRILSHTSGLPNWRPEGKPLKIFFTPGDRFSYSGEGFVYLQKAIEQLTGRSLNEIMKETVFNPLQMNSSSFVWRDEYEYRKARGHNESGNPQPLWKPIEGIAASSLHTTIGDYAKFVAAITEGRGLQTETWNEMLSPQIQVAVKSKECIDASQPQQLSESVSWGLGWGLQKVGKEMSFWHWGDNNRIFQSYVAGFPAQKTAIVILTNSGNGHSIIPQLIFEIFGETYPSFAWMDYEPYNSPLKQLFHDVLVRGEPAIRELEKDGKKREGFGESQINRLGYWLLGKKKVNVAVEVFLMNVTDYPNSWNAYDSLGEAYLLSENRVKSIEAYRKSLELNPDNSNAAETLVKLTSNPE